MLVTVLFMVAVLALAGCGSIIPTGMGAASAANPLEREAANMLLWTTRGKDLGLLVRAYCVTGSPQERTWMRDTYNTISVPGKVLITCPKWSED